MRMMTKSLLLVLFFVAMSFGDMKLDRTQQETLLKEAQSLFDEGDRLETKNPDKSQECFRKSADKFQIVVDSGVNSGWLYYDLGNAMLRSGRLGLAIANYKRAQQYLGDESKLQDNLDYARSLCQSKLPAASSSSLGGIVSSLNSKVPTSLKLWLLVIAWVVMFIGGCGWLFIKRIRWRWVVVPAAAVCLIAACSLFIQWMSLSNQWQGVVKADEVVIRKGNGTGYAPLYNEPLREGVEFQILDKRRDWLEVRLSDGKVGYVPADAVEQVKPADLW